MGEEYKSNLVPVILYVPDNTVKLTLTAKIMLEDDTMTDVESTLNTAEVAEARINGDGWEAENVKYTLTDEGRKYVEELMGC